MGLDPNLNKLGCTQSHHAAATNMIAIRDAVGLGQGAAA